MKRGMAAFLAFVLLTLHAAAFAEGLPAEKAGDSLEELPVMEATPAEATPEQKLVEEAALALEEMAKAGPEDATPGEAARQHLKPMDVKKMLMDKYTDKVFRDTHAVGGAFVIAKEGEIVYERYYGVQQKTTKVPVTEKSYFRCASVTKLITGIGILKMMDEGLLDPDEDISTYLGYPAGNPRYPDTPVTLRHLMSHTAGMVENASYSRDSSTLREMIALDQKAYANFKDDVRPGTDYCYSNFGAGITGSIVESVTGMDVSSYMRKTLFEPLGIDAAYSVTQLAEPEYITATYRKDGKLYRAPSYMLRQEYIQEPLPDQHYRVTVGSLQIRPRDLARIGIAICGDGTVDGVRVLSEKALQMMRQEQSYDTTGITSESPYNFFTIHQDTLFEGRRVYGHQGTDEGVVCNLYVEPESELVICVMTNGCQCKRDNGIMRITRRLAAIAEKAYLSDEEANSAGL